MNNRSSATSAITLPDMPGPANPAMHPRRDTEEGRNKNTPYMEVVGCSPVPKALPPSSSSSTFPPNTVTCVGTQKDAKGTSRIRNRVHAGTQWRTCTNHIQERSSSTHISGRVKDTINLSIINKTTSIILLKKRILLRTKT